MPLRYHLTASELDDLEFEHRHTTDKRYADRVKTVYLLGKGWSVTKIAEALLIDRETVRNHFKRYRKGGLPALQKHEAGGSDAALNEEQRQALDLHLRKHLYLTAKEIAHYVEQTWQVAYSESGMTQLLHRMGYVYKKPKLIPGTADVDRQRLNINGAIDCASLRPIDRYDDTINAQSAVALLKQIEQQHPRANRIHIICDNARYYRSQVVSEYLLNSKIVLIFLPPYTPNLNLIERYWRFFKKEILSGKYYQTFVLLKQACDDFFATPECHK